MPSSPVRRSGAVLPRLHGGSGSELRDIHEALDYGVVKMNVDTDMQYAFTRAIADHCFRNYDGVLKVDGEVGTRRPTIRAPTWPSPRRRWRAGRAGVKELRAPERR
jgi:fructose/tagatose bisphosphate aldolase